MNHFFNQIGRLQTPQDPIARSIGFVGSLVIHFFHLDNPEYVLCAAFVCQGVWFGMCLGTTLNSSCTTNTWNFCRGDGTSMIECDGMVI